MSFPRPKSLQRLSRARTASSPSRASSAWGATTRYGEVKQSSDLSLLIHDVAAVVSYLSQFYHLQPGDLIYTGTPEGVGPAVAGDRIEGSVAGIGSITVTITPAE